MKYALIPIPLLASLAVVSAATPPAVVNYQGVLRNASDTPLTGSYDMVFRFYSDPAGGDEILQDIHTAAQGGAVTVSGGLFSTQLGDGFLLDGSGPGTYSSLSEVFRDYGAVYMSVQVGAETLTPRTRILAAAYALNATNLNGRPDSAFLDTSPATQIKTGPLWVQTGTIAANMGINNHGVEGYGPSAGAYFKDLNSSGNAYVGYGDEGIAAYGSVAGGSFYDSDNTSHAYLAYGSNGIEAYGRNYGGYFEDSDNTSRAYLAVGSNGIEAYGINYGGYFGDLTNSGYAYVGYADYGISAHGAVAGGAFVDLNGNATAFVASGGLGIHAEGDNAGGRFVQTNAGLPNAAYVAFNDGITYYKIRGAGQVSFVQNHPTERDKSIVYAAPEGDEVAVYTRGTARLIDGEARVALAETFQWVANPDIGLTAHLTARGSVAIPLAVESLSTRELVVRGPDRGPGEITFDYMVYGLRIGYEQAAIVQGKKVYAALPPAEGAAKFYTEHPDLRRYSALERFQNMALQSGATSRVDLSRSHALAAAINVFDPTIDGPLLERHPMSEEARSRVSTETATTVDRSMNELSRAAGSSAAFVATGGDVAETSPAVVGAPRPTPSAPAVEPIEIADVLVADPTSSGAVRRSASAEDPLVVGIAISKVERAEVLMALPGTIVACKVDAAYAPIHAGDLLTTSPTPGHAMRSPAGILGTIVGKALEDFGRGSGSIRVLVLVQ